MRPAAMLGAIVALCAAIFAVVWLSSYSPASSQTGKGPGAPVAPEAPSAKEADVAKGDQAAGGGHEEPHQDALQTNPFEFAKEGPQPKAELVEEKFNFTEMILGTTLSHDFVIRNTGEAPLKLAKGTSTCKCTIPSVSENAIPPGGEVTVKLTWKPIQMDWSFAQQATVWTNDPEHPSLVMVVEGRVVVEGFQLPEASLGFGEIKQGESRTVSGFLFARQRDDLEIKSVETSTPKLSVTIAPADETALAENGAASGFKFDVTIAPGDEVGLIQESIRVHTNFEHEPLRVWQVGGNRPGPVKIVSTNWFGAKQVVRMGTFQAAEGARQRLAVFLDKTEAAAEVTDVRVAGPIKVRLERDDPKSERNPERDQYWMWVEFPAGGPATTYGLEKPLPVEIFTTHPKVPSMKFNVAYEAN
jgi:hypothetical protein